jgi:FkbM family methyltransferase
MSIITNNTKFGNFSYFRNDHAFIVELYKGKIFEEDLIAQIILFISHAKCMLDIGAHAGSHSFMYSKINPNAHIFSFEPQKEMFKLLNYNLYQNNNCTNVKTYNMAVGHIETITHMMENVTDGPTINNRVEYGTDSLYNLGGLSLGSSGESVNMITIDKFVQDNNLDVDYMKIDVEGAEPLVIRGAMNTIKKFKPIILFEDGVKNINHEMIQEFGNDILNFPSIKQFLNDLNYRMIEIDSTNFIGIPKDYIFKYV